MSTRVAFIGGGSQGIGFATAARLAGDGVSVVINGRREPELRAAAVALRDRSGVAVDYVVSDMADPAAAESTLKAAEAAVGPIDVLVLNAGGPPPGRILDIDDAGWRAGVDLLLLGPLRLAGLALPAMAARRFGRLIFITSTAVRQPQPDLALSVVLRAAVTSAAKLLSQEYASDGVTVNCVAPGATDTERRRLVLTNRAQAIGSAYGELARADSADIPAGRAADPDEVAAVVAFLASEAASYVNGTAISVDGGRTETV